MTIEILREAVAKMRERAEAATPGPWEASVWDSGHSRYELNASVITEKHGDRICDMDGLGRSHNEVVAKDDGSADAQHIASWHPDVALAAAALLELIANRWDEWQPPPEVVADWRQAQRALALARAYLGRDA